MKRSHMNLGWVVLVAVSVGIRPAATKPRFPQHVELANIQRTFAKELPEGINWLGTKKLPVERFLAKRNLIEDKARKNLSRLIDMAAENNLLNSEEGKGIIALLFPTAKQKRDKRKGVGHHDGELLIKLSRKLSNKTFGDVFWAAIDFSEALDNLHEEHHRDLKSATVNRREKNRLHKGTRGLKVTIPSLTQKLQDNENVLSPLAFGKTKSAIRKAGRYHLRSGLTQAVSDGLLSAKEADEVANHYFGAQKSMGSLDMETEARIENRIGALRTYPSYRTLINTAAKTAHEVTQINRGKSRTEDKMKIILTGFTERMPLRLERYISQGGTVGLTNAKALNSESRNLLQRALYDAVDGNFLREDAEELARLLFPERALTSERSAGASLVNQIKEKVPRLTAAADILRHAELFSTNLNTFLMTPATPVVPPPVPPSGLSPTPTTN